MTIKQLLVVDDDPIMCACLSEILKRQHFEVTQATNSKEALAALKKQPFQMIVTDMRIDSRSGLDILRKAKELHPEAIVVVVTGHGSIENAVEAMRLGAFDYLTKPFSADAVETIVQRAKALFSSTTAPCIQTHKLTAPEAPGAPLLELIGASDAIRQINKDIALIAKSHASVFVHGESGTGKEVVAQAIHYQSLRAQGPFIKVNCAAVPETLIESEFFGHEKGAFTGANARRAGRFELAHGGTLLLDEITEIPLSLQAKLLRVLQEHEFERVGGNKPIKVDVRIVSTSNRDISQALAEKILREDLYYRLNVVPIQLPPLRERREDILPLANHFLQKLQLQTPTAIAKELSPESQQLLLDYSWPGNARELANIIERAVVMSSEPSITPEHLHL